MINFQYYSDPSCRKVIELRLITHRNLASRLDRKEGPTYIEFYEDIGKIRLKSWFCEDRLHRDHGPAFIKYGKDGSIEKMTWANYGMYHREDGPAKIIDINHHPLGSPYNRKITEYWLGNRMYNKERYDELIDLSKNIKSNKNLALLNTKHEEEFIRVISREVLRDI